MPIVAHYLHDKIGLAYATYLATGESVQEIMFGGVLLSLEFRVEKSPFSGNPCETVYCNGEDMGSFLPTISYKNYRTIARRIGNMFLNNAESGW